LRSKLFLNPKIETKSVISPHKINDLNMKIIGIFCLLLLIFFVFSKCTKRVATVSEADKIALKKIKFDLSDLDLDGLRGKTGGKTSVDYEFCIPAKANIWIEFQKIDPSLKQNKGRGRVGCGDGTWLVIGATNQPNWRDILLKIARRSEIKEIQETVWE
jgi:hypothetical protein